MQVTVLGSGSRGNSIVISTNGGTVLLDAGFPRRSLARRARSVGIDLTELSAIVLTHEHGDHARCALALARETDCPVYASQGTLGALKSKLEAVEAIPLEQNSTVSIGLLRVTACRTRHDAVEPLAIFLEGPRSGERVAVAYDLGRPTAAVRRLLRNCNCLLVEANHDEALLRTSDYPMAVRERIAGEGGHLSNHAAARLLAEVCHKELNFVVLVHVSDQCNRPELARQVVGRALKESGFRGRLLVASQDTPVGPLVVSAEPLQLELQELV